MTKICSFYVCENKTIPFSRWDGIVLRCINCTLLYIYMYYTFNV